jgi:hypothetical protein
MPTQLLVTAAVALIAWVVLLRVLTAGEGFDLADLFRHPGELPWPRGVQEEEPQRWRLELLDRRPAPRTIPTAAPHGAATPAPNGAPSGLIPHDRAA